MSRPIQIVAAVLAHIRGEISAAYIADMFGVKESDVHKWKDVFQVAGVLALGNVLKCQPGLRDGDDDDGCVGPPTTLPGDPPRP